VLGAVTRAVEADNDLRLVDIPAVFEREDDELIRVPLCRPVNVVRPRPLPNLHEVIASPLHDLEDEQLTSEFLWCHMPPQASVS
jgi:hypothetical protein